MRQLPHLFFACLIFGIVALTVRCAAMGGASGTTGKVQLTKDVACQTTLGESQADGTKSVVTTCDVPQLKDAAGACTTIGLDTGKIDLGKGYSCKVTVTAGAEVCRAIITTLCILPVPKPAAGGA